MKKVLIFAAAFAGSSSAFLALPLSAATVNYFWNNSSTNMNTASSYSRVDTGEVSAVMPDSDDFVWFDGLPEKQPHLSASLTLNGIRFASTNDVSKGKFYASTDDGLNGYNHCGWILTGAEGAVLTLNKGATLGQSENNQCVIASCSYGTNRVECPVQFPTAAKIMGNAGRLVLAGPISQSANGTTRLMDSGGSGGVVLAAANPNFLGFLDTSNGNIELAHTNAICAVKRVGLVSSSGGGTYRYFRNLTGGELVDSHPFEFWMEKCEATVFAGPPMRFPAATLCPDSGQNRTILVDTSLTVGAVSNRNVSAGTTAGRYAALDYYGAGSLHVLGDFGPSDLPGVTNVLRLLGGTVVFHDPQTLAATPVAVGQKGTNSRRPRLGIPQDLSVKAGLVPGGEIFYYENCNYGGWAAYGGDHTVTMEATTDGVLKLRGWKGDTTGLSANVSNWNGSDWWILPGDFYFGAEDADGTGTLAHDIDVNLGDNNATFGLGAFQGDAFVAGRIAGSITNSVSGFLPRWIRKDVGDGAVAIDGQVFITGGHYVSSGGLLFNGPTAGSVTARTGGWLGGTGTVGAVTVQTGGAIRGGEQGGELEVSGNVTMADGGKFIVDIGENTSGCVKFKGNRLALKASGKVIVVPSVPPKFKFRRKVKILDWSEATDPTDTSLFTIENYEVAENAEAFASATLSKEGSAIYLTVKPLSEAATMISIF